MESLLARLRLGQPQLVVMAGDNLVPRPWGGRRLLSYKRVPDPQPAGRFGESFEVAAFPGDRESREHPSQVCLPGGSRCRLIDLIEADPIDLLGEDHVREYGAVVPLLPKLLDVCELLSVQAHPPGQLELYVIIEAQPGATMRLGFRQGVKAADLAARLVAGRRAQERLLEFFHEDVDQAALQAALAPRMAARDPSIADAVTEWIRPGVDRAEVSAELAGLSALYWEVLDLLNEIPLVPGQVILNATPLRIAGAGPRSAEIHALGSPAGQSVLALEIRRPGTTLRAWDNVRFPLRDIDVAAALAAANLEATAPDEFLVDPCPVPGTPGVFRLLDSDAFVVDSLRPRAGTAVLQEASGRPHTLHAISGAVRLVSPDGPEFGALEAGQSALVPACLPSYQLVASSDWPDVIKVTLP